MPNSQTAKENENFGEVLTRPGFLLRRCLQETGWIFEETCAELGLTQRQYDFLYALSDVEERDQDQLARLLGLDRSTTGVVIRILLRKGYVERRVKPADKRKRLVCLTDKGREIFKQAKPAADAAKNYLLDMLDGSEKETFIRLLQKIVLSNKRPDRAPLEIETVKVA